MKTRTDKFKEHWAQLQGKDLLCYRRKSDTDVRVMHCLTGTYLQQMKSEINPDNEQILYPLRIVLPPMKSRIIYFENKSTIELWSTQIRQAIGLKNVNDFYCFSDNLGKGQFGVVKLGTNRYSGVKVAVKTIAKANMKPIEVF